MIGKLPKRGSDDHGSGEFGASRGRRKHKGIDYACYPGTQVHSPIEGRVTKRGYPYAHDLSFRYIEVTSADKARHRFFYVHPGLDIGTHVHIGDYIGYSQDIAGKYSTLDAVMKNHIHYEILTLDGTPINPEQYVL